MICQTFSRIFLTSIFFVLTLSSSAFSESLYELEVELVNGKTLRLADERGQVVLFVNFTLGCATTEQLRDVQSLYEQYAGKGVQVIALPTYEFAPASVRTPEKKALDTVCTEKYGTRFPVSKPVDADSPLVQFLVSSREQSLSGPMSFNFEKFLISRTGELRYRFGAFTSVESRRFKEALGELLSES